jgi:SAM-dependent methyltransferase
VTRDTDRDWDIIATHQPFFGVLASEQFLMANLTPAVKDAFYETGRSDIEHIVAMLSRLGRGSFAPSRALDFGCGVGRLTFAMTKYAPHVVGVDVAQGMLDVAAREAEERGIAGLELRTDLPAEPVDWINSLIVLQHIPPARGYQLLEQMVGLLAPGGFFSVQLTIYRDNSHTSEITRDLGDYRYDGATIELLSIPESDAGAMTMFDYDLTRVLRILHRASIDPVLTQHTDHGGCHGVWLFGVRGDS